MGLDARLTNTRGARSDKHMQAACENAGKQVRNLLRFDGRRLASSLQVADAKLRRPTLPQLGKGSCNNRPRRAAPKLKS